MYDWSWENNINNSKELIDIDEKQEHPYSAWRTNSTLSNFSDAIHYVNEINLNHHLSDKLQYHYLFYSIRKQKRYGKKKTSDDKKIETESKVYNELIALIQDHYKYNIEKAKQALKVLSEEQIDIIRNKQEKGG